MSTEKLPYYSFVMTEVAEVPMMLARTGYSGELGYELYYPFGYGEHVWDSVMAAGSDLGVKPAGMAALLTTRIEKRFPIMGLDIFPGHTPVEAGIGWTVRKNKGSDYIGRDVLDRQKSEGTETRLVALELPNLDFVPKKDDSVAVDGKDAGKVPQRTRASPSARRLPSPGSRQTPPSRAARRPFVGRERRRLPGHDPYQGTV